MNTHTKESFQEVACEEMRVIVEDRCESSVYLFLITVRCCSMTMHCVLRQFYHYANIIESIYKILGGIKDCFWQMSFLHNKLM